MTDHPPDQDPTTIRAQIAAVTIQVTCECGEQLCHEIECEEDDFGGWSAAPEVRHPATGEHAMSDLSRPHATKGEAG